MKKLLPLFLALLLAAGCAKGFNAQEYVQASLDKIYHGRVDAYAKQLGLDETLAEAQHKLDMQAEANTG